MNIHDVKRYTEYLCRLDNKVDSNGFYFLILVWKRDVESNNLLKKRKRKIIDKEQLEYLIETAEYIEWDSNTISKSINEVSITDFVVTKKFLNLITVDSRAAFKELQEIYPKYCVIQGKKINARNLTLEEGERTYEEVIKNDRLLHFKIIEIVKDYKRYFGEEAPKSLKNFIKLKEWDFWEETIKDLNDSKNLDAQDIGEVIGEHITTTIKKEDNELDDSLDNN